MSKRKTFFIVCGILCGVGMLLALTGRLLGGAVTGVGYEPGNGLVVYSPLVSNQPNGPSVQTDKIDQLEPFTRIYGWIMLILPLKNRIIFLWNMN